MHENRTTYPKRKMEMYQNISKVLIKTTMGKPLKQIQEIKKKHA
jgi:hypothetical protein